MCETKLIHNFWESLVVLFLTSKSCILKHFCYFHLHCKSYKINPEYVLLPYFVEISEWVLNTCNIKFAEFKTRMRKELLK